MRSLNSVGACRRDFAIVSVERGTPIRTLVDVDYLNFQLAPESADRARTFIPIAGAQLKFNEPRDSAA